jgi:glutaredoxin-like protein
MLENREGQRVPEVTFRVRRGHEWVDLTSSELFNGKRVALFSLPGAFTPTCSSSHVPRYNELADTFRANGIDEIACLSVNDTFVMNAWQEEQQADRILFLPDGNGEFSEQMGMLVDKGELGFGKRSWRYSMVVNDGVIEKMWIEPDEPGDPYGVSDADTMLKWLAPGCKVPHDVVVFSRLGCPFCAKAKSALQARGIAYEELVLNRDYHGPTLRAVSGSSAVPQVFIDGEHIGGSDRLEEWLAAHPDL